MSTYNCKYYKQKKQVSYDNKTTWEDVSPAEYRKGDLYSYSSQDCSYEDDTNYFTIESIDDRGSRVCIHFDRISTGTVSTSDYYWFQYKINNGEWIETYTRGYSCGVGDDCDG